MSWLALDIGGANLKAADGSGFAISEHFPLWKNPQGLAAALRALIAGCPPCDHLAATMTGELADCFATKRIGVEFILQSLVAAADQRHSRVYLLNGKLVTPQVALKQPLLAAASNWHALARFVGRYAPTGTGILLDIGSTTCDIIPLRDGHPCNRGHTDTERLLSGELVYTGVERSPVCAVAGELPYRGEQCPTAQELFATMWDAYLMLGLLPEEADAVHTADGRPATKAAARDRLARSLCADRETFTEDDALAVATELAARQRHLIIAALDKVVQPLGTPQTVIVSGRGEFLARQVAERLFPQAQVVSLQEQLGPVLSRCAPAHALAVLAREGA